MKNITRTLLIAVLFVPTQTFGQTLIDSIPYPGMLNLSFWGIDVTPDTIFLGADGPGDIYFSNHDGVLMGNTATGYTYNHGLIKRESSFLIVESYSTSGALLHEIGLNGQFINEYLFPPGSQGNAGGVGDIAEAGDGAIWFTVYHPDFDEYPYSYAYKWVPGTSTLLDTVPLLGKQPYGVTVKGDTLFYVIDNIHDDQERIYAYDLTNNTDLYWIELPDTPIDNDQRPFGLDYDGESLYLIANRQGGSAFAHQTIFIYSFDITIDVAERRYVKDVQFYPNPANDMLTVELPQAPTLLNSLEVYNAQGQLVHHQRMTDMWQRLNTSAWEAGMYVLRITEGGEEIATQRVSIIR